MTEGNVYPGWTQVLLQALEVGTKDPAAGLGPPAVARLLALIYGASYQAWAAYDDQADPWVAGGHPRQPAASRTPDNRRIACSHAIFSAAMGLFETPVIQRMLRAHMRDLGLDPSDTTTTGNTAVAIGNRAAELILSDRLADGANQDGTMPGSPPADPVTGRLQPYADYTGYKPKNAGILAFSRTLRRHITQPGRWQPLGYVDAVSGGVRTPGFIGPQWSQVRPFALSNAAQFRPRAPEPVDSQAFVDQARHVLWVQENLTPEQMVTAEYWADGPKSWLPPGHWCEIAMQVSLKHRHTLSEDARLFFALTGAILDASIATWEAKVYYDYCRPISAIRWLFERSYVRAWGGPGVGMTQLIGAQWRPFQKDTFPTPPFAEYTSGHSAFSMAAAAVLRSFTGDDMFTITHLQEEPLAADPAIGAGVRLAWDSFTEAAASAGESRLFGGIHFHQGNVAGLWMGEQVGQRAWQHARSLFH